MVTEAEERALTALPSAAHRAALALTFVRAAREALAALEALLLDDAPTPVELPPFEPEPEPALDVSCQVKSVLRLCGLCRKPGHRRETCPDNPDNAPSPPPASRLCGICREPGHRRERCPHNPDNAPAPPAPAPPAPAPPASTPSTQPDPEPARRGTVEDAWDAAAKLLPGEPLVATIERSHGRGPAGVRALMKIVTIRRGECNEAAQVEDDDEAAAPTEGGREGALDQVLLVGGIGRMLPLYRQEAQRAHLDLIYVERADAAGTTSLLGRSRGRLRAVLIFTSICAHPIRDAAKRAATAAGVPIKYLNGSASVLKLRQALASLRSPVEQQDSPCR